jgi:hypothetical protein
VKYRAFFMFPLLALAGCYHFPMAIKVDPGIAAKTFAERNEIYFKKKVHFSKSGAVDFAGNTLDRAALLALFQSEGDRDAEFKLKKGFVGRISDSVLGLLLGVFCVYEATDLDAKITDRNTSSYATYPYIVMGAMCIPISLFTLFSESVDEYAAAKIYNYNLDRKLGLGLNQI